MYYKKKDLQVSEDYIERLLMLNESKQSLETTKVSWDIGLVAEGLEFFNAYFSFDDSSDTNLTKEAGDMLAFTVLSITNGFGFDANVVHLVINSAFSRVEMADDMVDSMEVLASSVFRKYNRVSHRVDPLDVVRPLTHVMYLLPQSITMADVERTNIEKLESRFNRGTMFEGSGNDR